MGKERWDRGHRCRGDAVVMGRETEMGEGQRGAGQGQERLPVSGKERRCHQNTQPALALVPHARSLVKVTCKYRLWGGRVLNSNSTRRKTGSPTNLNTFLT